MDSHQEPVLMYFVWILSFETFLGNLGFVYFLLCSDMFIFWKQLDNCDFKARELV